MNCPVDGNELRITERQGIEIDYCPQCRGIWLDRGELEKIMAAAREEGSSETSMKPPQPAQPVQPRYSEPYRPDYRRYDDDDYRHKKRRGKSIFDIFD
jgi:Zn-finger nucleic acid-binding protein